MSKFLVFTALCIGAVAGNYFGPSLSYGVDLLFGAVAVILATALFGMLPGMVVAAVGVVPVASVGSSPFILAAYLAEPLVLGFVFSRWRQAVVLIDLGYWLVIGIPLLVIAYKWQIGLDWWTVLLVASVAFLNGGLNALFAGLALHALARRPVLVKTFGIERPSLRDVVFHAVLAAALIAGALPILEVTRSDRALSEREVESRLSMTADEIVRRLKTRKNLPLEDAVLGAIMPVALPSKAGAAILAPDGSVLEAAGELRTLGAETGHRMPLGEDISVWFPNPDEPAIAQWLNASFVTSRLVNGVPGAAIVVVEEAAAPIVTSVRERRSRLFFLGADVFIVGIVIAMFVSRWLSGPLVTLQKASTGITGQVARGDPPALPRLGVAEYDRLSSTLREMSGDLSQSFRDAEESRQRAVHAKEVAELANRSKSVFLATVSHELRTPLNAILGFSEFMTTEAFGPLDNPRYREYVRDIHQSGSHLLSIINDILVVSAAESGSIALNRERISIETIAKDAVKLSGHAAAEKSIDLSVTANGPIPEVSGDPTRLRQILINLISNSIKYTDAGGSVAVEVRGVQPEGVSIVVKDTGIGISGDAIENITKPFYRAGESLTADAGGVGLGLTITDTLVRLHGGTMEVTSEVGKGTRVEIVLPAASRALVQSSD